MFGEALEDELRMKEDLERTGEEAKIIKVLKMEVTITKKIRRQMKMSQIKMRTTKVKIILKMTWSTMTFLKTIVRTRTMGSMYRMKRV